MAWALRICQAIGWQPLPWFCTHARDGEDMNVIVDLCVVPVSAGLSLSRYVAACERVIQEFGLEATLHANGTNIQGEWDDVFAAIKKCHQTVHAMGVARIFTTIKLGTRTDKAQTMQAKIESVREKQ